MEQIPKFNKRRAFNKAVGPGKKPKLINIGPTFIPDYKVMETLTPVWSSFLPEKSKVNICEMIF
jgi:hypothetical protein